MNESADLARSRRPRWLRGLVSMLCITAAVVSSSAFIIGGMLAGASGATALLLIAAVPLAGFFWALALSVLGGPRSPSTSQRQEPPSHHEHLARFDQAA